MPTEVESFLKKGGGLTEAEPAAFQLGSYLNKEQTVQNTCLNPTVFSASDSARLYRLPRVFHMNRSILCNLIISVTFAASALLTVMASTSVRADDKPQTFAGLKNALLEGESVRAILDLSHCHDPNGNAGPTTLGGVAIREFMIVNRGGTEAIAFSLLHMTILEDSKQIRNEFVRYRALPDGTAKIAAFTFPPGVTEANPVGSWTCNIGNGIKFRW